MKHPCQFSKEVLDVIEPMIRPGEHVHDPFAGPGFRLAALCDKVGATFSGGDIEDWPGKDERVIVGDALASWSYPETMDVVVTSPVYQNKRCLERSHRVLTSDLRWVPVGDVEVGDTLMAFDVATPSSDGPRRHRRKWRRTTVVHSAPRSVECLRVILANGDEIITTPEHPWLVRGSGYKNLEWRASSDLLGIPGRCQPGLPAGGWQKGRRPRASVLRQTDTWTARDTFDAGWLSGMFDGEGSLSLAVGGGSPKLSMTQALGPVLDRAEAVMSTFGYEPYRCVTAASGQDGRKKLAQLFIPGGFPGVMRVLGELRPMRLLDKWDTLDFSDRSVEATPIEVLRVESAGVRDIQEITTSEGTYLGEGYLMHNCGDYANGPTPTTKTKGRRDYGISLGRALSENNLARYTGRPRKADEYWELHAEAVKHWPDRVIVNVDEPICERWIELLHDAGYPLCSVTRAYTQRYAGLANADVRAEFEVVILAER